MWSPRRLVRICAKIESFAVPGLRARRGHTSPKCKRGITSLGPVRAKLIKKGMVYSPSHGGITFTVPLFDEFMCAIREFQP